jgi:hypothetical protein
VDPAGRGGDHADRLFVHLRFGVAVVLAAASDLFLGEFVRAAQFVGRAADQPTADDATHDDPAADERGPGSGPRRPGRDE